VRPGAVAQVLGIEPRHDGVGLGFDFGWDGGFGHGCWLLMVWIGWMWIMQSRSVAQHEACEGTILSSARSSLLRDPKPLVI